MCNLNILIRNEKFKGSRNIVSFMQSVSSASFQNNGDGDGLFCDYGNFIVKSKQKLDLFDCEKIINKSDVIISHQRKATSGFDEKYTHPFSDKDFVLVHNGIVNDFIEKGHSDTYSFFAKFCAVFRAKNSDLGREKRIVESIKELLDDRNSAMYSIAIYDLKAKKLYYFKDNKTSMNIYRGKGFAYLTTSYSNNKFLSMISKKHSSISVKDYLIYKIVDIEGKISLKSIGIIEHQKEIVVSESSFNEKGDYSFTDLNDYILDGNEYAREKEKVLSKIKRYPKNDIREILQELGYNDMSKKVDALLNGLYLEELKDILNQLESYIKYT